MISAIKGQNRTLSERKAGRPTLVGRQQSGRRIVEEHGPGVGMAGAKARREERTWHF